MALATQCPFCQTTFRVAQDQLKLRGGLVRCGSCKEVFNGNEHLVSPEIAQQLVAAPVSATPSEPTPPPLRAAPTAWPPLPGQPTMTPTPAKSAAIPPAPPKPAPVDLSAAFASIAAETKDAPWGTQKSTSDETPAVAASSAQQETGINTLTQELSFPVPRTSSAPGTNVPGLVEAEIVQTAAPQEHPEEFQAEEETEDADEEEEGEEDEDDEDAPAFVQKAERRERLRQITGIVMGVGAVVLSIALLLQAAFVWRNTIAAWLPATRPLLSSVCATLHCSVGLPTNIDQLALESSELQLVPPNQNIYTLSALLRNRGYSAQAWPYLELTLNDADEKAITRRVFTPREYLGSARQVDDGLAGESEQQVKLTFELAQPAASGYRIYLFYP